MLVSTSMTEKKGYSEPSTKSTKSERVFRVRTMVERMMAVKDIIAITWD